MGIYIPKEFPKNCNDCPCTSGWNCFADDEMRDIAEYDDNHTKPDWCPLIEVLTPHGDLIYREYAIAAACSGRIRTLPTTGDGEDWIRVKEVLESIKAAPTIIPAEEGGG